MLVVQVTVDPFLLTRLQHLVRELSTCGQDSVIHMLAERMQRQNKERQERQEELGSGGQWIPFALDRIGVPMVDSGGRVFTSPSERVQRGYARRYKYHLRTAQNGDKLLNDTGRMLDTKLVTGAGGSEGYTHLTSTVYTDEGHVNARGVPIAFFHQDPEGKHTNRELVPERAFLGITERDSDELFEFAVNRLFMGI